MTQSRLAFATLCPPGFCGRSWWIQPFFKYVNKFNHMTDKSCRPPHPVSLRWLCIALLWSIMYWLHGVTLRRQSSLPRLSKCLRKHCCSPLDLAATFIKTLPYASQHCSKNLMRWELEKHIKMVKRDYCYPNQISMLSQLWLFFVTSNIKPNLN